MKLNVRLMSAALLTLLITFTACTKESTPEEENNTELTTQSDDQSQVSMQMDAVSNDAALVMESSASFGGGMDIQTPGICDATVSYDTSGSSKKVIITYNGKNCSGAYKRTGSVVLSMLKGVYWKNAGAALTVTYQNLKVTRVSDTKSVTLNGSHTVTNVSGGLLIQLPALQAITHTISSDALSITFDDNTKRTWQVAQKRVFTYNNGVVVTVTGNHTEGTTAGIVAWGINRFGRAFTTSITQPFVIKQDCSFRVTGGQVKHEGWATATATYGLNADGVPTTCPSTDTYYFKVAWTGPAGNTYSKIMPY